MAGVQFSIWKLLAGFLQPYAKGIGIRLFGSSSGHVGLLPKAAAGSTDFILPAADGSSGWVLTTDGSGNLSFAAGGGSGGSPGGTSGQIQYNNAGAFAGFTASGDVSINASTGACVVNSASGVGFGSLAFQSGTFSGTSSGTNTGDQNLSGLVPKTTTVAGHALSSNVSLAVADVSGAAPLASPTFTGTAAAPTPLTADNSTKIATTGYVQAQGYITSSGNAATATLAATVTTNANLTGPITSVGNVTSVTGHAITYAMLQQETLYSVLGNNTASTANSAALQYLVLGSPTFTTSGFNLLQITASANTYAQMALQNSATNAAASTDYIVTADNGNDATHYADFGINSSLGGAAPFSNANAAYLYSSDNELDIGALGASGVINFYTTGFSTTPILGMSMDQNQKVSFVNPISVRQILTAPPIAQQVLRMMW